MESLPVTVIIAARNEAANIQRCLEHLRPAQRVVVVDSHSSDDTGRLATAAGAEVVQFHYTGGYPKKRQWALDQLDLSTEWVLLLDADEVVPDALWREIGAAITSPGAASAYAITKGYHFLGRRFRFGGFSHAAVLLVRRGVARFEELVEGSAGEQDMEVHERVLVQGSVGRLRTPLIHEDFKGLEAYVARHNLYSTWEARLRARFLDSGQYGNEAVRARPFGTAQERRRFLKTIAIRTPGEPMLWFLYHYLLRLGILEGRRGLIACQIRHSYIAQVRAKVFELRLRAGQSGGSR